MKKKFMLSFVLIGVGILFFCCKKKSSYDLTVASYLSFADNWGAGRKVVKDFEKDTGYRVNLIGVGSQGDLVKAVKKGEIENLDVVAGISQAYIKSLSDILESSHPFDYSYFTLLYKNDGVTKAPKSVKDLALDEYEKKFILLDPSISSVGLGFLRWSYAVFDDEKEWIAWWEKVMNNALTIATEWSHAYTLFEEGEAPLMISYLTSPLSSLFTKNQKADYEALVFDEGHIKESEYIGILKNSKNKDIASQFESYVLEKENVEIAKINAMYPTAKEEKMPPEYGRVSKVKKVIEEKIDVYKLLEKWENIAL